MIRLIIRKLKMIGYIVKSLIGSKNDREIKRLRPVVEQINGIEAGLQKLSDEALRQKTADWKTRLHAIKDDVELAAALEEILPQAFAVVKNACRRLCGQEITVRGHPLKWEMVPFDVQLIGGVALHKGKIAEMATGEGKTLVATLPVYLNALDGPRRASGDGERLSGGARHRVDGGGLQVPGADGGVHPARPVAAGAAGAVRSATSLTERTRSSGSIICGTTAWRYARRTRSSAAIISRWWTRWTRS